MNTKVYYPNLSGEIAKRGIKKKVIAESIGICRRSLQNRMNGKVPFSYSEANTIRKRFFPDLTLDYLLSRQETGVAEDGEERAG